MTGVSVALYLFLAFGLLLKAAKYAFGPVSASHHRAALERDGAPLTPNLVVLLRAIYIPMSAAIADFAVLLAALAVVPIAAGEQWASMAATGAEPLGF
ncbi:hypothetical protein [Aureimonas sp. Leaf454]|uniref:hypothetical protein n=1 Tax=Aureimonas sp. Leaf454 TaxID=1736381 RepID=UPI00138F7295|nr:hypothetical protein [Aureimonas sp. Leaf454]